MEAKLIINRSNSEDDLYDELFQTGFSPPPTPQTDAHQTSQLSRLWSVVHTARLQRHSSSPNKIAATLSRSQVSSPPSAAKTAEAANVVAVASIG